MPTRPVYLDNAATTFPKPAAVLKEVSLCLGRYCGNPGRGSHPLAMASAERIFDCREAAARLLGVEDPGNIVFTMNTTYAINMFLKGLLRAGDHVLISDLEHNSVFRPICKMAKAGMIEYDIFPSMCGLDKASPTRICAGIARRMKPNTRLVICTHQSNICSYTLPVGEIGAFCHRHGLLFAVDAAQSAGHLPINMKDMNIDALTAPGHKGLYGIQGVGLLALSQAIPLETLVEGGSGILSLDSEMPELLPERLESGTLPTPAIAGLLRGIETISHIGTDAIGEHERMLFRSARERLNEINGITIYVPQYEGSTLLFSHAFLPSEELASRLGKLGICTRGGYHCSPLGHATVGTPENGAVRISFGLGNSPSDIDRLMAALSEIL